MIPFTVPDFAAKILSDSPSFTKDSFHIQWHITNFCHLRCKHCYQEDFSTEKDLDLSRLKAIGDNLSEALVRWERRGSIHLTGGEPLLKGELIPLLAYLDEKPMVEELGIITNGLLLNQEFLDEAGRISKLKKIRISLDGAEAKTHNSIRQTGSFEKVLERLRSIDQQNRFEILFMFTLMKRNYQDTQALIRLAESLGMDGLILERFIPLGKGRAFKDDVLEREQWKDLLLALSHFISSESDESELLSYQAFRITFDEEGVELSGAPCILGKDGLCIMPEGTVFPCRRFPVAVGNLLRDPLQEIWEGSEILEVLRKKENLKGRCRSCGVEDCRGCRSLAFALTGDYLAEDPHCPLNR